MYEYNGNPAELSNMCFIVWHALTRSYPATLAPTTLVRRLGSASLGSSKFGIPPGKVCLPVASGYFLCVHVDRGGSPDGQSFGVLSLPLLSPPVTVSQTEVLPKTLTHCSINMTNPVEMSEAIISCRGTGREETTRMTF